MLAALLMIAAGVVRQDWYTFEPEAKNFRVELPEKPNSSSNRTVTGAAGQTKLTTVQLRTAEAVYTVQVSENPGKVDPKTLDEGIRRFAAARRTTLGPLKPVTVSGSPGREFDFTEGPKKSRMRWVASGNSLFMLTVAGKPGAEVPTEADRFFGSLEIGLAKATEVARAKPAKPAEPKAGEASVMVEEDDTIDDGPKAPAQSAVRKPAAPTKITISRMPKNTKSYRDENLEDLSRSFARDREGFRDVGPAGSVLVGVRVSYIERFGGPKIRSAQPLYRTGKNHYAGRVYGVAVGPVTTVVARPGYAVGGLVTHTGLTVDGFRLVFMKVDGDRLDPGDSYDSPWIGDDKGGSPGEVTSKGGLVVGLQGRSRTEVNALGLTTLK